MKRKFSVFIVIVLLCISSVVIFNSDVEVEASPGGGGEDNGNWLNNSYIWDRVVDFCNVIYDAYDEGDIPKGRSFGSKGGAYTVDNITIPEMNAMGLEDVHTEQIQHIDGIDDKNYTTIINVTDFQITVNNVGYPYDNPVPKNEMFVIACGFPPAEYEELTANYTSTNAEIKLNNMTKFWPFAGTYNDFYFSSTNYNYLKSVSPVVVGNVTYLAPGDTVPDDNEQYGRVFLLDDNASSQDKLDNITRAQASFIIDSGTLGIEYVDASNCPYSVVSISNSDGDILKELLENFTVLVDNVAGNLTFTYNLSDGWWPNSDYVFIDRIPDHYELWNITEEEGPFLHYLKNEAGADKPNIGHYIGCVLTKSVVLRWISDHRIKNCTGILLYDSYDYHYMLSPVHFWNEDPHSYFPYLSALFGLGNTGALPIFTMNYSVGNFLRIYNDTTTITGYADQVFQEETPGSPGVEAYNVVGNITIDESPDDAIAIISNRYDGMWGQTPGDSGVGGAIVLGIAKYFKDHNIMPKYNLTFLFTTAEEYGLRGIQHYNDSHQSDNIKYWFILDQLAFDQQDTALCTYYINSDHEKVINEIMKNQTRYWERTCYDNLTFNKDSAGSEQSVASSRGGCNSFCFVKDQDKRWDHWHRAGMNYIEGDTLKYTDRNDVNVTAELVWNITKYFIVDPDCWFKNINHNLYDSGDSDSYYDAVNVSYTINTSMPHDRVMIRVLLISKKHPILYREMVKRTYTITAEKGISDCINISLKKYAPKGCYTLKVFLYNSTGEINNILYDEDNENDQGIYANEIYIQDVGYMHPPNAVASKPTLSTQSTNVLAGTPYTYTANSNDGDGDQVYYQWDWITNDGHIYTPYRGLYDSGQDHHEEHMWTSVGDMQVRVRARDQWYSPNVWSDWSDPLDITVNTGCSIEGPTMVVLGEEYQFTGYAYGFEADSWSWNFYDDTFGHNNQIEMHSYTNPAYIGDKTVTLNVTDDQSNEYSFSVPIEVVYVKSDFNVSDNGCVKPSETINFSDMSDVYDEYSIDSWLWDFDDGTNSTSQNPSHNYTVDGVYNVTLMVTDDHDNIHTSYQMVHVDSVAPMVISAQTSAELFDDCTSGVIGSGHKVTIYTDFLDNNSGTSTVWINITDPDGNYQNQTMNSNTGSPFDYEYDFTGTEMLGWYYYDLGSVDNSGNANKSAGHCFYVSPIIGYTTVGGSSKSVEDNITGSRFKVNHYCEVENITAYVYGNESDPAEYQCMIYKNNAVLVCSTETKLVNNTGWYTFNISGTKPVLNKDSYYYLTIWGNNSNAKIYYNNYSSNIGAYHEENYTGTPPSSFSFTVFEKRIYSIYCNYTPDTVPPEITSVSDSPDPVGIGCNITIQATVIDNVADVDTVKVSISDVTGLTSGTTDNMTNTEGDTYQYVFNNTWKVGQYSYTITAQDKAGNPNITSTYSFDVSSYANLTICSIYDDYTADQYVNLTDPPSCDGSTQMVWYELLDNSSVLHIWNKYDSYFFNTSSGIQLTNHYDEYWSTNVLMLGYYNNDEWNLIYRTDELSGFNKNIETDNKSFVNVTLWKNLTYSGYDFRLAIRYHLGMDDKDLMIIPYIKAYEDIPYVLGFAWEIKDIQIDMTEEYDYIEINDTMYYLNTSLDETYTELEDPVLYIRENMSDTTSESLYLKWNNSLNYKVKVKSRDGQYNAPVTLAIRIGTLDENQSKHTKLYWHDASEITYYFNGYDKNEAWATNPGNMVNEFLIFYATTTVYDTERCNSNTCDGSDLGDISNVKIRAYGKYWNTQTDITLYGIYGGEYNEEDENVFATSSTADWSSWYDITDDTLAPDPWDWDDIKNLGVLVEAEDIVTMHTLYCSKVELRVTYTPNTGPDADNPHPASGTMGISLPYTLLNITVTDVNNDTMNVTWYTNKSGSWQSFATNNSVANNTVIQQNYTNLTENGKWWYWKVNVTDGTNYSESPVYSFYTGYQSKIENTGSTDIKGCLLMQVHFYNTTSEEWVVDDDTINESNIQTISDGGELGLDSIFNGEVYTGGEVSGDLSYGYGTYRVYAVFRDPNGNILETSYGNKLEGWYEFEYSNS